MPSAQHFFKLFHGFLKNSPAFSSFPFSLLLIGLEELMEKKLSCPCKYELNIFQIVSIFIGPPLFGFALMFLLLRPCKYKCSPKKAKDGQQNTPNPNEDKDNQQNTPNPNEDKDNQQNTPNPNEDKDNQQNTPNPNEDKDDQRITINTNENKDDQRITPNANENKDDQQKFWKALGHCLIPPVMWIIILFLDGDYLACGMTEWEGNYVFDKELNRSWCQPIEEVNAEKQSDLQRTYQGYISISKAAGYIVLAIFGVLIVVFVGIYDCCKSEKSVCCKSEKSDCYKGENSGCCKGENSGCCKGENSGCGWCKIFASCKIPSTCCKGADVGTGTVNKYVKRGNEDLSVPLQSKVKTVTTAENVIDECV